MSSIYAEGVRSFNCVSLPVGNTGSRIERPWVYDPKTGQVFVPADALPTGLRPRATWTEDAIAQDASGALFINSAAVEEVLQHAGNLKLKKMNIDRDSVLAHLNKERERVVCKVAYGDFTNIEFPL